MEYFDHTKPAGGQIEKEGIQPIDIAVQFSMNNSKQKWPKSVSTFRE